MEAANVAKLFEAVPAVPFSSSFFGLDFCSVLVVDFAAAAVVVVVTTSEAAEVEGGGAGEKPSRGDGEVAAEDDKEAIGKGSRGG